MGPPLLHHITALNSGIMDMDSDMNPPCAKRAKLDNTDRPRTTPGYSEDAKKMIIELYKQGKFDLPEYDDHGVDYSARPFALPSVNRSDATVLGPPFEHSVSTQATSQVAHSKSEPEMDTNPEEFPVLVEAMTEIAKMAQENFVFELELSRKTERKEDAEKMRQIADTARATRQQTVDCFAQLSSLARRWSTEMTRFDTGKTVPVADPRSWHHSSRARRKCYTMRFKGQRQAPIDPEHAGPVTEGASNQMFDEWKGSEAFLAFLNGKDESHQPDNGDDDDDEGVSNKQFEAWKQRSRSLGLTKGKDKARDSDSDSDWNYPR